MGPSRHLRPNADAVIEQKQRPAGLMESFSSGLRSLKFALAAAGMVLSGAGCEKEPADPPLQGPIQGERVEGMPDFDGGPGARPVLSPDENQELENQQAKKEGRPPINVKNDLRHEDYDPKAKGVGDGSWPED